MGEDTNGSKSGEVQDGVTTSASVAEPAPREVDPRLLAMLACPVTKRPLIYDREHQELISKAARLAFPIKDGVPLLTLDSARNLDD
ncbi:MAG: Trm112 family protein [Hyphomicrobiaceae bacterium]